jgi:hypothetical protein
MWAKSFSVNCFPYYSDRLLGEFDFRYNNRKVTDGERAQSALKGFDGKRLTYKTTYHEN